MTFFRPKRRQDAKTPQIAAEDGVGPGLLGEDLGGGRQEPLRRRIRKEDLEEESGDLGPTIQHADPGGRRIASRIPPGLILRSLEHSTKIIQQRSK